MSDSASKTRVAILGGGMGSLAAAWALSQPDVRDRFAVTVHQQDWLLGGKGASTRSPAPDRRIQEHGVHLLLGFYDEALGLLRQVYEAVHARHPDTPLPAFDDALEGWDDIWMAEEWPAGTWTTPWLAHFPPNAQRPGVPRPRLDWPALLLRALRDVAARVRDLVGHLGELGIPGFGLLAERIEHALAELVELVPDVTARALGDLLDVVCLVARHRFGAPRVRHAWIGLYLAATNLRGALRDGVLLHGTAHLDDVDYRAWLRRHDACPGLPAGLTWNAPPVLALYDLAFSRQTGLAAGVTLRAGFRMLLDYAGHFAWKMKGGMGEIVFAPLYLALRDRGVRFRFCEEVTALRAGTVAGAPVVEAIELLVPEAPIEDAPLIPVTGSDGGVRLAWPDVAPAGATPRVARTLRRAAEGDDGFDVAVLGISVGALQSGLVGDLRAASPAFDAMVAHATTVPVQAAQLWMTASGQQLGWPAPQDGMVISYARPMNAWVDMSHVVPLEHFPPDTVRSVHYLCDELYPNQPPGVDAVRDRTASWLANSARRLWPNFTWGLLYDPAGRQGPARLEAQYFRSNDVGSERYVTAGPGSLAYRLAPGATGFRNLAIAGDWVRTELSCGCLESATQGGLGAGRAIVDGSVRAATPDAPCGYVRWDGDWGYPQPASIDGARMIVMPLLAGRTAVEAACAARIDGPSGGRVRATPLVSGAAHVLALLAWADFPRIRSGDPSCADVGTIAEQDVALFVPVRLTVDGVDAGVHLVVPYLWVDNPAGVIEGRETFGFPKILGAIQPPDERLRLAVETLVFRRPGPGEAAAPACVLEVQHQGPPDDLRIPVPDVVEDALRWAMERALDAVADHRVEKPAVTGGLDGIRLALLKQFRTVAAGSGNPCCYQEVVQATFRFRRLDVRHVIVGTRSLVLYAHASLRIADTLGLQAVTPLPIAVEVEADLELTGARFP